MKIGYARVSKLDQNLDSQVDALKAVGCEEILTDKASGVKEDRPGLRDVFRFLREGDTLYVYKLDRLARSFKHLIELTQEIEKRKAHFISLQENIDTTTVTGKLIFHIFGALAEFERGLLIERTRAGIKAAKARGRSGGRVKKLDDKQVIRLNELFHTGTKPNELIKIFGISRQSVYNYLGS
jgi:DNA invertase Pin-like site-specific DNA recombinase